MVVNAPTSNIVSAAEHAVALLLSVARNVPQAAAALKAGQWKRAAYTGVELQDKVVGILGLGRVAQPHQRVFEQVITMQLDPLFGVREVWRRRV